MTTAQQDQVIQERLNELKAEMEARGLQPPAPAPVKKAAPAEAKSMAQQALDYVTGLTLTSAQAPMLNTADEVLGTALSYPASLMTGEDRPAASARINKNIDDYVSTFQKDHPLSSFAGQAGTTAALLLSLGKFLPKQTQASMLKQVAVNAPAGGILGFGAGMGAGEGDLEERLPTGMEYAVPGMAFGAATPLVGPLLNKAAQTFTSLTGLNSPASTLGTFASKVADPVKKGVLNAATFLGVDPLDAKAMAERKLNDALKKDSGASSIDDTLSQLEAALNTKKKPITVAEVFDGDEAKQLAETVGNMPGPQQGQATKFFNQRQRGTEVHGKGVTASSADRILEDLKAQLANGRDFDKTAEEIITARRTAAGPKYGKLAEVSITPDDELLNLADRLPAEAFSYGGKMAKLEGNKSAYKKLADYEKALAAHAADPQAPAPTLPELTMQELDYVKQGMDDYVNAQYTKEGTRGLAGKSKDVRDQFRDYLDALHPEYKDARDAYAGKSAMLDALELGRNIFTKDFDEKAFKELTSSEKELARLGAFQAFKDLAATSGRGANLGGKALDKRGIVERYANLFDDEEGFTSFIDSLKKEQQMSTFGQRVTTGSQTARRVAGKEALEGDTESALADAVDILSNPASVNTVKKAINYGISVSKGLNRWVASEIGDMSFKELDQSVLQRLKDRVVKDKEMSVAQKAKTLGYLNAVVTGQEKAVNE